MYVYVLCVSAPHGGQKKALGLVVLELQGIVFPDTGALRQTWDHCKNSRDL